MGDTIGLTQDFTGLVEPDDPGWKSAPKEVRKRYYDAAGALVLDELSKQLGKGIGRNGKAMRVRKQPVLADGADGPVMEPHYDLSRVITLSDYMATDHSLKLFWHAGTGHSSSRRARKKHGRATPFGTILGYHAAGEVPHAPVRDVRLCKARLANVRRRLAPLWKTLKPKPKATPKGVEVKTSLPRGLLKGPGLIDTKALKSKPFPGTPPEPPPKPVVPKPAPAPRLVVPPAPSPVVHKPSPAAPVVLPPPKPIPVPEPPRAAVVPPPPPPAPKPATWAPRKQSEFREIGSIKDMEAFGRETSGAWAEGLTPAEAAAIRLYAANEYKWMNAILRGTDPHLIDLPHGLSPQGAGTYIERTIRPLARAKIDRDVVAFRGVKDAAAMGLDRPDALEVGRELVAESFSSCTLSRDKAAHFATSGTTSSPERRVVLQINTPKGSSGAYLNAGELSGYGDEREVLVPPGARLRFVRKGGVHKDVWGNETQVLVFERVD